MPTGIYKRTEACKNAHRGWHHTEASKKQESKTKKKLNKKGKRPSQETEFKKGMHSSRKTEFKKGHLMSIKIRKKIGKAKKGEKNSSWKGGITPLMEKIRRLPEYKQWRSDIFQRDNWTCQTCQRRGNGRLEAHHNKKGFSEIIKEHNITSVAKAKRCKELWDIDNGITLCGDCHDPTKKGRSPDGGYVREDEKEVKK